MVGKVWSFIEKKHTFLTVVCIVSNEIHEMLNLVVLLII